MHTLQSDQSSGLNVNRTQISEKSKALEPAGSLSGTLENAAERYASPVSSSPQVRGAHARAESSPASSTRGEFKDKVFAAMAPLGTIIVLGFMLGFTASALFSLVQKLVRGFNNADGLGFIESLRSVI